VTGWAAHSGVAGPVEVLLVNNGWPMAKVTTGVPRPDVVRVFPWAGPNQGFDVVVGAVVGTNTICGTAEGVSLGCLRVTVANPYGDIDVIERSGPSTFHLRGWVIDPDTTAPSRITVFVNGRPTELTASLSRPDVDAVHHLGADHGFDAFVSAGPDEQVCWFWLNTVGAGTNQLGGCRRDPTWGTLPPPMVPDPSYTASVSTVTAADLWASWRPGCPVGPDLLRRLTVRYWGFDSQPHVGTIIVHAWQVDPVLTTFRIMYEWRYPIERLEPVESFGGSDDASMAANNTSAFNCRAVTGGTGYSQHAIGGAIDLNPALNPYVFGNTVLPARAANYLDRGQPVAGLLTAGSIPVSTFLALGWGWGGNWTSPRDYQHLSFNNR
jgi:hypothetical protein